jgi:hypothetical protein
VELVIIAIALLAVCVSISGANFSRGFVDDSLRLSFEVNNLANGMVIHIFMNGAMSVIHRTDINYNLAVG